MTSIAREEDGRQEITAKKDSADEQKVLELQFMELEKVSFLMCVWSIFCTLRRPPISRENETLMESLLVFQLRLCHPLIPTGLVVLT